CRYRSHGRLNEAAAAADASRGLTGQLRCPKNKIGVSRKMSIEYPYEQLPCQTQGGFLQTALSAVTRRSRSCSSPVLLRRVTPDRVLVSSAIQSENFSLTNSPTPRPRVDRECVESLRRPCDRQLRSCCQVVAVGLAADQSPPCAKRGSVCPDAVTPPSAAAGECPGS